MKLSLVFSIALSVWVVIFIGCADPVGSTDGSGRYVTEASEANLTGAGNIILMSEITVGTSGGGGRNMPNVVVYGDGRANDGTWKMIMYNTVISEGQVRIDPNEYPSYYYRVVVIK